MEVVADAACKVEADLEELEPTSLPKFDIAAVEAKLDKAIGEKVDQKLQDFLNGPVTDALRAALEAFSSHVGVKIQICQKSQLADFRRNSA